MTFSIDTTTDTQIDIQLFDTDIVDEMKQIHHII